MKIGAVEPGLGERARLGCRRVRPAPDMVNFEQPMAGIFQSPCGVARRCTRGAGTLSETFPLAMISHRFQCSITPKNHPWTIDPYEFIFILK